ncbi:hypothetical protein KIN20_023858 [Parelaphostrongylus tenuis]|uniref:Uncharacterized protein n=1 Tax=Parelaphostrongylus tenuis TaxID=148309 RepID=A0AAD5QWD3_PARTN|nr:hypothetical protein KIN20_023858 [Parelaphostrongylus tenuis]
MRISNHAGRQGSELDRYCLRKWQALFSGLSDRGYSRTRPAITRFLAGSNVAVVVDAAVAVAGGCVAAFGCYVAAVLGSVATTPELA